MIRPIRLHLMRIRGFRLQEISIAANGLPAVNCTRQGAYGGILGNPWRIGAQPGFSRDQVVALHETWITKQVGDSDLDPRLVELRKRVLKILPELRGKNLACTCPLPEPYERDKCHCRILLEHANR